MTASTVTPEPIYLIEERSKHLDGDHRWVFDIATDESLGWYLTKSAAQEKCDQLDPHLMAGWEKVYWQIDRDNKEARLAHEQALARRTVLVSAGFNEPDLPEAIYVPLPQFDAWYSMQEYMVQHSPIAVQPGKLA